MAAPFSFCDHHPLPFRSLGGQPALMDTRPIVLASTSRYRAELLRRAGVTFEALPPAVDERAIESEGYSPRELAERLAEAKARAVAATRPDAIVIGSDQVCALDLEVLHKPGSVERAVESLTKLAGRTHELITAVCICSPEGIERHTDVARLSMRTLDRTEIERYVAHDSPLDCAGAYKLEERGIALFESVRCDDHSAITGLPLIAVISILRRLGVALP
jgi:septum formation protein